MKKYISLIALILSVIMIISLTGCKGKTTQTSTWEEYWVDEEEVVSGSNSDKNDDKTESGNKNNASDSVGGVKIPDGYKPGQNNSGDNKLVVEGAGQDKYAKYDVKGKVKVAVSATDTTDYMALFDAMLNVYPNIELEIDYMTNLDGDNYQVASYLSAQAAANNMPDVVFNDAGSVPTLITQGWVEPLDDYVKGDKVFSEGVPKNLIADYTYNGHLFALPHQATFNIVCINTDLLNDLNMDLPALNWNLKDFENMLKKATTDKTSAVEFIDDMNWVLPGALGNTYQMGYVYSKRQFDLSGGFIKSLNFINEMKSYPGLDAYYLRGTGDYYAKFGISESSEVDSAFKAGKILFSTARGTWARDQYESQNRFNYTLWPYPQETPGKIPVHVDHCFMTTAAKNKEAAFQVLRYITYSIEGNMARLAMYDEENKGKYELNSPLYYPTTLNPKISAKFKSLPSATKVDIYLYENIQNGFRNDLIKLVPGWNDAYNKISSIKTVSEIASVQNTANSMITASWKTVDDAIAKYYK